MPPALRRHQPDEGGRGIRRGHPAGRPVARLGLGGTPVLRFRLFRENARVCRSAHPRRQGLRGRSFGGGGPASPGDPHGTRYEQPAPRPGRRGEPGPLRAHEEGGISRRHARAEGEDRHGSSQPQHARPRDVPDPARPASPNGRRLVRVPDVRLGAWARGFDRGHYAFAVRPRFREPSAAVRLVSRRAGHVSSAADRVCASQRYSHGPQQAQIENARRGGARERVGRSPDADPRRTATPGLFRGLHPDLLPPDRRDEGEQFHGYRGPRELYPGGVEPVRPAGHGGPGPAETRDRKLPRRQGRGAGGGEQPGGSCRRDPHRSLFEGTLHRTG